MILLNHYVFLIATADLTFHSLFKLNFGLLRTDDNLSSSNTYFTFHCLFSADKITFLFDLWDVMFTFLFYEGNLFNWSAFFHFNDENIFFFLYEYFLHQPRRAYLILRISSISTIHFFIRQDSTLLNLLQL